MPSHRVHLEGRMVWLAALDALCLLIGSIAGIWLRLGAEALDEYFINNLYGWIYLAVAIIGANYVAGSYGLEIRVSQFNMVVIWAFSLIVALLVVSTTSYAWVHKLMLGRGVLLLSLAFYSALWLPLRLAIYHYLFRTPRFSYRVAILGTGPAARKLCAMVQNRLLRPTHNVVALIRLKDINGAGNGGNAARIDGIPVIEATMEHLADVIRPLSVDVVVLGLERDEDAVHGYPQLRRLRFEGVAILSALNAAEVYMGRVPLSLADEIWLTQASVGAATPVVLRFKRMLDVLLASLALLVAVPLGLLIAALIKLSAPRSPVLYSQVRVGRFGRPFRIQKFRTMVSGAEEDVGPMWSPPDDPRITRIGWVLRRCRLDELPQLFNILRGEMSIVGPRPERPEMAANLEKQIPFYRERENVVPGLTGWAQIRHGYGNTIEDARIKLEYDLYYIQNLSFALDLRIILRTLRIVVFGLERDMR